MQLLQPGEASSVQSVYFYCLLNDPSVQKLRDFPQAKVLQLAANYLYSSLLNKPSPLKKPREL